MQIFTKLLGSLLALSHHSLPEGDFSCPMLGRLVDNIFLPVQSLGIRRLPTAHDLGFLNAPRGFLVPVGVEFACAGQK